MMSQPSRLNLKAKLTVRLIRQTVLRDAVKLSTMYQSEWSKTFHDILGTLRGYANHFHLLKSLLNIFAISWKTIIVIKIGYVRSERSVHTLEDSGSDLVLIITSSVLMWTHARSESDQVILVLPSGRLGQEIEIASALYIVWRPEYQVDNYVTTIRTRIKLNIGIKLWLQHSLL